MAAGRGTGIGLQHVNDDQSAQCDKPLDESRGKACSQQQCQLLELSGLWERFSLLGILTTLELLLQEDQDLGNGNISTAV